MENIEQRIGSLEKQIEDLKPIAEIYDQARQFRAIKAFYLSDHMKHGCLGAVPTITKQELFALDAKREDFASLIIAHLQAYPDTQLVGEILEERRKEKETA